VQKDSLTRRTATVQCHSCAKLHFVDETSFLADYSTYKAEICVSLLINTSRTTLHWVKVERLNARPNAKYIFLIWAVENSLLLMRGEKWTFAHGKSETTSRGDAMHEFFSYHRFVTCMVGTY
jgi:hypothetical protein